MSTRLTPYAQGGMPLTLAVRLWATPSARDWRSWHASKETLEGNARPLNEQVTAQDKGGQLNPTWVCWLQGWPLDWEAHGPLSPQVFRAWLQEFHTALIAYVPWAMDGQLCVQQSPGIS